MAGYTGVPIPDQVGMIRAENLQHVPALVAAAEMWRTSRSWLEVQHAAFVGAVNDLRAQWHDGAGDLFRDRVLADAATMSSWSGPALSPEFPFLPAELFGSVATSHVVDRINELVTAIQQTSVRVEQLHGDYDRLPADQKAAATADTQRLIGEELDRLAPKYGIAAAAMDAASGPQWTGPRDGALPGSGPGTASPGGPTGGPPATDPASTPDPAVPPANPAETTPGSPAPEKSTAALDGASELLGSLGQAAQTTQQLLGGGGGAVPDPVTGFPPLTPGDGIAPSAHGGPGLAGIDPTSAAGGPTGGGGGTGGGGVGGSAPPTPRNTPGPPPGGLGATVPTAANAARTSTSGGASGGVPPVYPPQSPQQNTGGGNGIRPGAAEHRTDTGRSRPAKPALPGVALRGRTGGAGPAPVSGRRRDTGDDRTRLLDEELWQVQQDTGRRGGNL